MIQRRTQTSDYWEKDLQITGQDLARLYDMILDTGKPVRLAVLVQSLIEEHCRREEARIHAELTRGPVYQPRDSYEVGQQLAFPALEYAWGTVVGTRPARNPGLGSFTAIQVRLEGKERIREFAAGLEAEHKLNRGEGDLGALPPASLRPVAELSAAHGLAVAAKLVRALLAHGEFLQLGDEWFLRGLLVDVSLGQLNIAEALVEIKGMPIVTGDLLKDLDLPAEAPEQIRSLSLKRALDADTRFDNVGDSGRDVWYLTRLMPEAVVAPPSRLLLSREPYQKQAISAELQLIAREVDDESLGDDLMETSRPIYRTTIALTYPHWRSGTLPLSPRSIGLFPRPTARHTPVVLVDGQSGERMQGWVALDGAFVYGLQAWYQRHSLPVGTFVKLERTRDPRVITVDFEVQRLKRIWVKVAAVLDGILTFQMRKLPVSCSADELLMLADERPEDIDAVEARLRAEGELVVDVMLRLMPELVKLSPQGTVHAKTIYSAVNLLRRVAAGPVFAFLSTEPCFVAMGGGYFTFDESQL